MNQAWFKRRANKQGDWVMDTKDLSTLLKGVRQ